MQPLSRTLGLTGAVIALPAFVMNYITHGGKLPGPNDVDRLDGVWSLVLMIGAGLVIAGVLAAAQSPVGRKSRYLLYVEAAMITLAAAWSVLLIIDPQIVEDPNAFVAIGDACWPLHQAFMLVIGIVAVRARLWDSPARFALFGPVIGLAILGLGAALDSGIVASIGLGLGWFIAGLGTAYSQQSNHQGRFAATPAPAA